ncbi:hypothetical protein [Nigerium massiliense]|uniref:hypothetical protein n=1 Tax=Nigerium massiliense TaxID=1522317 RepID=UPI00058EA481|nr:hypothetical protein [Nigerium massiliense]
MTEQNNFDNTKNEQPRVDESRLDDTEGGAERGTTGDQNNGGRLDTEKLGEQAMKFASETAYAAAGFANTVADKAKAFFENQKTQYQETHPNNTGDPAGKQFLDQLSEQVNRFVEEATKGYRDMAERGRNLMNRPPAAAQPKDGRGPFDFDDVDADPQTVAEEKAATDPAKASGEVPLEQEVIEETVIADAPVDEHPTDTPEPPRV